MKSYERILRGVDARRILILGFFLRIPVFSVSVILTLHVVQGLGRSYADAGLVAAGATLAIAVSEPLRGRMLDRFGLRKVMLPLLAATALCWGIAPFVGYWKLLVFATIGGLFASPTFSIIRQGLMAAVADDDRRTVLSLDGVVLELSYMVGPMVSVWLTTVMPTAHVLFLVEMTGVAVALVLWWQNPSIRSVETDAGAGVGRIPRRAWFRPGFVAVCGAVAAASIVLTGSDVSIVAAVREWHAVPVMGLVLVCWSFGSIVGGLVYGMLPRPISPFALLFALACVTAPLALAGGVLPMATLAVFAGLFCAPTVTSTVDAVSRMVPAAARGEALGWHGSFMMAGSAIGSPAAGMAIDHGGFQGGFAGVALVGVAVAAVGWGAMRVRRRFVAQHALAA